MIFLLESEYHRVAWIGSLKFIERIELASQFIDDNNGTYNEIRIISYYASWSTDGDLVHGTICSEGKKCKGCNSSSSSEHREQILLVLCKM